MNRFFWTPEALALLGTDIDKNVAAKIGCNLHTIHQKRRELGIPSFNPHRGKTNWDEIIPHLGTMPDDEIARKFSVGIQNVRLHRLRAGIPSYCKVHKPVILKSRIPEHLVQFLGVYPDRCFSDLTGLSYERVRQIRELYGKPKAPSAREFVMMRFVEAVKRAEDECNERKDDAK